MGFPEEVREHYKEEVGQLTTIWAQANKLMEDKIRCPKEQIQKDKAGDDSNKNENEPDEEEEAAAAPGHTPRTIHPAPWQPGAQHQQPHRQEENQRETEDVDMQEARAAKHKRADEEVMGLMETEAFQEVLRKLAGADVDLADFTKHCHSTFESEATDECIANSLATIKKLRADKVGSKDRWHQLQSRTTNIVAVEAKFEA